MATHSSTLAWQIPWTEEPGRLQSMGSRRVGHDWATSLSLFTFMHWRRKWQPTPVFLPGESQGQGSLGGLPSMGSHRVGHDWSDLAAAAAWLYWSSQKVRSEFSLRSYVTEKSKQTSWPTQYKVLMLGKTGWGVFGTLKCLFTQSCQTLCDPTVCRLPGSSVHGDSPGKSAVVGCYFLHQGIFPTQGLNPGLLHCRYILYCLSHQRSPHGTLYYPWNFLVNLQLFLNKTFI